MWVRSLATGRGARTAIRWCLYPGLNLHARLRYEKLPRFFGAAVASGDRRVLDAGCGNGMLSFQSYLLGNTVVGVSFKDNEVKSSKALFNDYLGIPESRLHFELANLYHLDSPPESFDEIICSEVLEHLKDDRRVCGKLWAILKPGGILHVCAPNAEHPYNASFPLDTEERGGHVRPGYTLESYRALLEPAGFGIVNSQGLGGPVRQAFNWRIKEIQVRFGAAAGFPLFLIALPFLAFEDRKREREMPFSIYVKAVKQ